MAKGPSGRRRLDKFAMARSLLVLLALVLLAAATTGQHQHGEAATDAAWENAGDDNLEQRQADMEEAVKVFSNHDPASSDPQALKRAVATVNGTMAPLRPIFKAISRMPETTAAEVRAKEEARAAANELLTRHLGELLPGGSVKITDDL